MDRLLVIGSTGLVGSKLASKVDPQSFEVYNTQNTRTTSLPNARTLDISDRDATLNLVKKVRPKVIINTAALTNVDYCENHKNEAERVNVQGVINLAEASRTCDSRLVHISTDSVFDGTRGNYKESDKPHPINYYSKTKLESEKIVSQLPSYAIARPSVVYGWTPLEAGNPAVSGKTLNFAMFVLDRLMNGQNVMAVTDQYSSPTFADNLAEALLCLASVSENGVFHTAGRTCLNRFEFALIIAEIFGYSKDFIEPVSSSQFRQVAKRPKHCCLNVDKAERVLGMHFLTAQEGMGKMHEQITH